MFLPMGFQQKEKGSPTIISDNVTIGHNATIHACEIGKNALIGMGSVILDQSKIEDFAFVCCRSNCSSRIKSRNKRVMGWKSCSICKKNFRHRRKIIDKYS